MKKLILLIIFPLIFVVARGQNLNADSLINLALAVKDSSINTKPANPDSLLNTMFTIQSPAERIRIVYNIILLDEGELQIDRALYYHKKILEEAKKLNDPIVEAVIMSELGFTITQNGDGPRGLKMILQSLDIAEKTGNGQVMGIVYDNLGICYQGSIDGKIAYFRKAFQYSMNGGDYLFAYAELNNIGKTYYNLYKDDSAKYYFLKSFTLAIQHKFGYVVHSLTQFAGLETSPRIKIKYYTAALQTPLARVDAGIRSEILSQMALAYNQQGAIDSALWYASSAYKITMNLLLSRQLTTAKILAFVYKKRNADSALKYTEIYYAIRDSLYSINKAEQAQSLTFAEQQHEQEIASQKAAYKTTIKLYLLIAAIVFLLALAFVFWRNNKQKQKANHLLKEQKEEISFQRDGLENKNHELGIETALERVRSRSMGMQKSDELKEVIQIVYEQFIHLNIAIDHAGFVVDYQPKGDWHFWIADNVGSPAKLTVTNFDSVWGNDFNEAKEKGVDFFATHLNLEEKNKFYEGLFAHTPAIPEQGKEIIFNKPGLAVSTVLMADVALYIENYSGTPYNKEENATLMRFGNVFQQAYTRFLDLQKAELQAREGQIELGLERVRARAMSMQKSEELSGLVKTLVAELSRLDMALSWCLITILDEVNWSASVWRANSQTDEAPQCYHLPFVDYPFQKAIMQAWKERQEKWAYMLQGDEKKAIDEYMFTKTDYSQLPPQAQANIRAADPAYFYFSFGNFGGLQVGGPNQLTGESLDILARFGRVFDLSYTRFNDLKRAEAQASQAQHDLIEIRAARKKAEDALTELQVTQRQLIQSEKMASLGELTAGIAHEIQNPLNFVNNFSDVSRELLDEMKDALDNDDKDEAKEIANDIIQNLEKINHHGKRADAIVKGMLQHSRKSTGQKEPTDINALCDEYLRLSYHGLRAKDKSFNAEFKTEFDEGLSNAGIIPQDIGRVLLNLFNNAFYAVSQKKKTAPVGYNPEVSVTTSSKNGCVIIKVKDNGIGIPETIKDKIMQPFFTTKPTGEGTGLGLSLSNDIIVKGHEGNISVESELGQGSEFTIQLPIHQ